MSLSMNKEVTHYYIKNINDIVSLTVLSPIKFLQNRTMQNCKSNGSSQLSHDKNTVITRHDLIKLAEKQDRKRRNKKHLL